jgi:ribosomal protein S27AE
MPGFLDTLRHEIDRGIVQLGTRSRQLVEATQIRSQIRLLQSRRDQGTQELGQVVYEMLHQGDFDQSRIQPYITALEQINAQIASLEEQLRRSQEATQMALRAARPPAFAYCTCGEPLKETSKFCPRCGQDVRAIVQQAAARASAVSQAAQKTCSSCGATAGPAARFCPVCGHALAL